MNPDTLAQYLTNAPYLKKYRNMTPERAQFIESISQNIKYYMNEIEYNLKNGLRVINEFKDSGSEDTDDCQAELYRVVKNVEECSAGIQRVLAQEGAPTYYLLHGRVAVFENGTPIDSFCLHEEYDEDDSSSDDSDDEDGTERIMRRFGIRPAAQFTFSVTQTGDNVTVSDLETVYNHIPSLTQEQVEKMVMTPILKKVPGLAPNVVLPIETPFDSNMITATISSALGVPSTVVPSSVPSTVPSTVVPSTVVPSTVVPPKAKRGRPRAGGPEGSANKETTDLAVKKPRAKKVKAAVAVQEPAAPAPTVQEAPAVKKRGRPKKVPTTALEGTTALETKVSLVGTSVEKV